LAIDWWQMSDPGDHKVFYVSLPAGMLKVIVYDNNMYELACMSCKEPMLLGDDDYFNVVEDGDGSPVALLCVPCAKKAMERLNQ
jgi:hypothetical protein